MSKLKINRRDIILDKALEMFNERGIEYVGLRELAASIGMRVSNITYYFPTKDDLVYELSLELSRHNAQWIVAQENISLYEFLEMLHHAYQNHVKFRCLLLSLVHLMQQNKYIAAAYKKTQLVRNQALQDNIKSMVAGKYLSINDETAMQFLAANISLISRFWISEAAIIYRNSSTNKQLAHYLTLVVTLLQPHATAKGKLEIEQFLERI